MIFILSLARWQGTFYFAGETWKIHTDILKTEIASTILAIKA